MPSPKRRSSRREKKSVSLQPTPPAISVQAEPAARIVKALERTTPEEVDAKARALAGTYRVIHGSMQVPLPEASWRNADGTEKPGAPKSACAKEGDEVWLNDFDAARAIDANVVESLDARPSRVGKVWSPPVKLHNAAARATA